MGRRGFALLEILVAVAILAAIAGGGFYLKNLANNNSAVTTGIGDEQAAKQTVQEFDSSTLQEQGGVNQASGESTGAQAIGSTSTSESQTTSTTPTQNSTSQKSTTTTNIATTASASATTDPLAGLGSDKYADGILPLGDGKYVTAAPQKGYVYLCNVQVGGQGSQVNGPWIGTSTWNSDEKLAVEGKTSWPNASIQIAVSGGTRTIMTNDLPTIGTTGNFPIESTDPAYQYDSNPNSVEAQSLTFSLPANPTAAAAPQCIYGEVGVMTNGVLLLDAFDEEYHDAAAHELQDSCQGHPHEGGVYHYHSLSSCIPNATETNIIGWAFDGYPITGPEISAGRYLTTSDLDECHGITSPIMLNGQMVTMYHYVMTQDFPYSVSCFHGKSYEPMPGGAGSMGGMNMGGSPPPQGHGPMQL